MLKNLVLKTIKDHYENGHYLLYIPEHISIKGDFIKNYERYAGGYVTESNQRIRIFEIDIPVKIHQPFGKTHRYEYEYYFNFGAHCENYNKNKTVIQCPRNPVISQDKLEIILDSLSNIHNTENIIQLLLLLFLGGFVNSMCCIDEILNSISDINISRNDIFEYLVAHLE
jgi:hypothetical protein